MPIISIITATRNAQEALPDLLDSLTAQSCTDFELIVQDCLSTDATHAIVHSYATKLPCVSYASEEDTGIYDAWNKALRRTSGEWCIFLGADDALYSPTALQSAVDVLVGLADSIDYFATSLVLTLPNGEVVEEWYPSATPLADLPSCMALPHPALWYRSRLFTQHSFDTSLRIAGDYDFICRSLKADRLVTSRQLTSRMRVGGISASLATLLQSELECLHISRRHFPRAFPCKLYARICRSALYLAISRIAGEHMGRLFADGIRQVQGKPPLWRRLAARPWAPLPAHPHIALVVTVVGRTEPLKLLLHSLQQQTYSNFSIILVDQHPPPVLEALAASFPTLAITHLHIAPSAVSYARNVGLQHAQGDIIAFPDDDCWYEPDTLTAVVAFFSRSQRHGGLLGKWVEAEHKMLPSAATSLTRYSAFARSSETYVQFYRQDTVRAVGNFDATLGPGTGLPWGCGEDTDYVLRALESGFCIGHAPLVKVHHPRPAVQSPLAPHLCQKHANYALGRMYLLKKHAFPLWFRLLNVLYPLALLPLETVRQGRGAAHYRWAMFVGRLRGLFL